MVNPADVPAVTFNNGKKMPVVGLGTWLSKPGEVKAAVEAAIDAGYRHIDGAYIYGNETEVGEGIRNKIEAGVIKREDIFYTTKVWNTYHSAKAAKECLRKSLDMLKFDYADLVLVHWPFGLQEGGDDFPKDENDKWLINDIHFMETWGALEEMVAEGLCKSIGVSNFNVEQVKEVVAKGKIKPVLNQVESHPWFVQREMLDFLKSQDIVMQAYSPMGSPQRPWVEKDAPTVFEDPALKAIAEKHGKTVAQVCIKFQVQRGVVPLPKSVTPSRIASNVEVFGWSLGDDDMKAIEAMDQGEKGRGCHLRWVSFHPLFPFAKEV